ncbi:uncharacterized protein LOC100678055 isoform X2 [Nasonia vitripennis]|uniref:G-protein coupled receptors family 3 profile domain-containing protein n=1 Tax=Nasonia vitripennis TaxID=7425 RepID=A0A7M7IL98_NASVI|nr:uncharacterized protein LOC100678055 isoform X2 [Nasonia vitripennis]
MKRKHVGVFLLLLVQLLAGDVFGMENLVCFKNHSVLEMSGDAVLSVFIDTDYGPECNISSPKSIQEVASALFVAQTLNKLEYVPGVTMGLRLYDTCNDRISVYKQALVSAVEMDCSAHYDLGILAPERYIEVLEPLRSLDILPVNTYPSPNLTLPLIDVLVDFLSVYHVNVDLLLSGSRSVLDRFLNTSKEAGICVKSDKELEPDGNGTDLVIVALGDYEDVSGWLDDQQDFGDEEDKRIWIVLPLDNSNVDELLPEGSYVIKPEQFVVDLGDDLETPDLSQVPVNAILRSPHLLSIGKAIVEIAKVLQELQQKSCPFGSAGCVLPRFESEERRLMSNADLYETLHVPAKSHSTRYVVNRKVEGELAEISAYKIDATSARFRVIAEKELPKQPKLCVKKLVKNCWKCINFQVQEHSDDDDETDISELGTLKSYVWVPIFLTILCCGTLACIVVLVFIVYRYFVEDLLDGNPALTIVLILATMMMLQSIIPFCLEDKVMGEEHLNSRKIFVSSLSFGLAFSVMLTRALFLAFSTGGVFSSQHINGYLQGFMLFFMAGVEIAISTMYFTLSSDNSAKVMRSPIYIALLSYDIFLLILLFIVCCFIVQIQRNYREGICFFSTAIGLLICWAVWLTCFFLMSVDKRDLIVCYGILGTACLIIVGILVPRTYFMCSHFTREKDLVGRFEPTDLGPDPRMNNTARQSRQPFYEYVSSSAEGVVQQQQMPQANYYGSASPNNGCTGGRYALRHRSPEPRRTPGYNNYGFRPEMRELEAAYVIPRLYVEDSDVSGSHQQHQHQSAVKSALSTIPATEARYALPRSLLRNKARGKQARDSRQRDLDNNSCVETEVYVQDRLSPTPQGPNEHYPRRSSSPKLTPTHATIREEDEAFARITRF